ncbi:TIGR04283 family arsenosugar biosynthesis glycosyltransferase [Halofilum ochraceum]|uniref:TIGR04283 family arsenosugar biosynthesis glycosyltransferase n=1 Tax=Halofilum ochraceum TaxID=1611323 RepID=UPI0008D94A01|nr:TIGR04283 family arsenosugar biosynthesis glycosyltransferase [Halofilum ochraceum]
MQLSVIVPALDEGAGIAAALRTLAPVRARGGEIILVDGGSVDDTVAQARPFVDRVIDSTPGRAVQMNAGAAASRGDWLWFVHADSRIDAAAVTDLEATAERSRRRWARFGVRLSGDRFLFRTIAFFMNARSCLTGIATGDQGIAMERALFESVGGYPEQPLMEDIALSRLLRSHTRPACLPVRITTSSRRWEQRGAWRTIWLMWSLRFAYWRGTDPASLAQRYRGGDPA